MYSTSGTPSAWLIQPDRGTPSTTPAQVIATMAVTLAEIANSEGLFRAAFLLHEAAVEARLTECETDN